MIQEYNNQIQQTPNMRPGRVTETTNIPVYQKEKANKYSVGQKVRISKAKHIFSKGYTSNWTTEVFEIIKVNRTAPFTYTLRDLERNKILGKIFHSP